MLIKSLYHLQELEKREQEIRQSLKSLPQFKELKSMKERFLKLQDQLARSKEEHKKTSDQLKNNEERAQDLAKKIKSLKEFLYGGSSNNVKELENIDLQIKVLEEQMTRINQEIIDLMEGKEQLDQNLKQIEHELKVQYQTFNKIKLQYNRVKINKEQELKGIEEDKEEIITTLDEKSLSWYQERKEKYHGRPIGEIMENHACSGCRSVIPIIIVKEARSKKDLVYCENCGRLLYAPQII
ncbi:zinc ribbon domain-containing protein [Dehalobacterium formicoaceticum]|uniref:zinc ribbon domain-containing protein n=1 Tax=Dehalobacterium formicoaceticum TaxID=51515 RepID=UPI000B7F24AE|nr:C4-type zinc ribbon domain-containing protein [Dehalobacterium formicoaceticum]